MSALRTLQDLYNKFQAILPEYQAAQSALAGKYAAIDPASPTAQAQFDALKVEQAALAASTLRKEYIGLLGQIRAGTSAAAAEDPAAAEQIRAAVFAAADQNNGRVTNAAKAAEAAIANEKSSPKNPENTLPPTGSAAADVANSAAGATQNPAPPPTAAGRLTTTEADKLAAKTETGTNAPVRTLTETQSVNNTSGLPVYSEDGSLATSRRNPETGELYTPLSEGRPGGQPGVGAKGDDGATAANTTQIINAVSQAPFRPRDNVLDQYASYTYNIGWYLMTPEQYTELQKTSKISVSQYNLLVQSGGAPSTIAGIQPDLTTTGVTAGTSQSAGRNPFFALDYYLDNLEIQSVITGKGTNSLHNATALKFTVTETAGITLIDNLWKAVKQVYKGSEVTYSAAYYALIIRFYGYDENGKIIQASDSDNKNAVVEKIIPFRLTDIQFSVANKLVEYQISASSVPHLIGFGSNLGVVKKQVQIAGGTVKDVLTKGVELAAVSADDGRKTTPAPATPATPPATSSVNDTSASAGVDINGNFTGDTASPFAVVAP
jgi:hypothetical protein